MTTFTARKTFQMLDNESLWDVARRVHELLCNGDIDHAIVGGVAVCLHGYRRNTVDLDLLIRPEDSSQFRAVLDAGGFQWFAAEREYRSPSGIAVQVLLTGDSAGPGQSVKFPDPTGNRVIETIEELPVLSLSELIQAKLACGIGNLRRTHKDFADVVELIAIHKLDGSFARFLHSSVRDEYRALVKRVA